MPPRITRNHEYAKVLSRTVKTNRGFTSLANTTDAIDSADVAQILSTVSASSLEVYDTLDSLPTSSLTKGGQGYVKATQRLYVSDSFGWYSMALVNLTPTQTLDPSGNITLSTDGTSTIVTITATDSDQPDAHLSYSIESDGNMLATGTTVTQDSSVFTITPLTAAGGGIAGNFTLTFKTTDNVNIASTTKDFSLAFSSIVDSSTATVLLMKADGNSATNAAITYQNSSDVSTGFTETGNPQASTFSPYRSGGYSAYFPGAYNDRIFVDPSLGSDFAFGTGDFTVEAWVYLSEVRSADMGIAKNWSSKSSASVGQWLFEFQGSGADLRVGDAAGAKYTTASTSCVAGIWYHVAVSREGSTVRLFVDGVSLSTTDTGGGVGSADFYRTNGEVYIGYGLIGYIKDLRVIKGTAVYTANFTAPTEPLTAISGTELLTCHLPYFADGSTNADAVTIVGDSRMAPFGPFDYSPWTADDVGGSVRFDGSSYVYASASGSEYTFGSGNFTVEAWYFPTTLSSGADAVVTTADTNDRQGIWMGVDNDKMFVLTGAGSWLSATSTASLVLNQWNHLVAVRNGNTVYGYLNGTQVLSYSESRTLTNSNNAIRIGGRSVSSQYSNGYVSDVRIIKGTAQYTSNFTPPTAPLSHTGSGTSLLMNNKSDANVYDAAAANILTLVGNTQASTTQRKFTTSSAVYFDGNGDAIDVPEYGFPAIGTLDFTIEVWVRASSLASNIAIFDGRPSGTSGGNYITLQWHASTHGMGFYSGGWRITSPTNTLTVNTWHHIALSRSGSSTKLFVDGTQVGSTYSDTTSYLYGRNYIGGLYNNTNTWWNGYMQDFRVSIGTARYTANFTPATTEFEL